MGIEWNYLSLDVLLIYVKNIFSNKVVYLWNDLDQDFMDSITENNFKNKLDNCLIRRWLI